MKKAIGMIIFGIVAILSTVTMGAAYPVLDDLDAWQAKGFECVMTSESGYQTMGQGGNIELEVVVVPMFGRAVIKVQTYGHDTEGANIKHCCRFDGQSAWQSSPLQPSPSSYTFREVLYGSGSRYVIVEAWVTDSTGFIESESMQIEVWVTFSLW